MATTELGHRDVFGLKLGPAGVVVQVFQVRGGRVVERIELGTEDAIVGSSDGEVLIAAMQQFYEMRGAPPEIHVPAEPDEREALESWLGERAGRRVKILVPQRGEKRGFVDLANRNAALAYRPGSTRRERRTTTRSKRCSRCSRCHRCRDGSSVSIFRRSRAARPSHRWSSAKTGGCAAANIGNTASAGIRDPGLGIRRPGEFSHE